jgi:AcrR family transcriptional regulator
MYQVVRYQLVQFRAQMAGNGRRRGRWQRDELALAAADWVIEHGLSDLSLRRLAAGLGLSHRALLYHFGSKDELFQAILRAARTRERLRAVSLPEEGQGPGMAEMLRRTWTYLSAPREHAFWRFYFESTGLPSNSQIATPTSCTRASMIGWTSHAPHWSATASLRSRRERSPRSSSPHSAG